MPMRSAIRPFLFLILALTPAAHAQTHIQFYSSKVGALPTECGQEVGDPVPGGLCCIRSATICSLSPGTSLLTSWGHITLNAHNEVEAERRGMELLAGQLIATVP